MDFRKLVEKLEPKVSRLIDILNDPNVSPALRLKAQTAALDTISQAVYSKTYDMTAFDYEIRETVQKVFDKAAAIGVARTTTDSMATGDRTTVPVKTTSLMSSAAGAAQYAATSTAKSLGKHTVLRVSLGPKKDCDWCIARARRSPIYNPSGSDFGRHDGCDCLLETEGYKSRNGEVKNYRAKPQ